MCVDVSSTILHGPQNVTVSSQSTANFRCESDGLTAIYWKYAEVTSGSSVTIFDRRGRNEKRFGERFVNTMKGTTSILTIRNVQKSDAGSYSCRERNSHIRWHAQLMVFG